MIKDTKTESVMSYPRPPIVRECHLPILIKSDSQLITETKLSYQVLEKTHPPSYYIRKQDINMHLFEQTDYHTTCEFKGIATYWNLKGTAKTYVAWSYEDPTPHYQIIKGLLSFYPHEFDEVRVNGEKVKSEDVDFYGGWWTSWITG